MKVFRKLRKPYISIIMSFLTLFISCEQGTIINEPINQFDYNIFNSYSVNKSNFTLPSFDKAESSIEKGRILLDHINNHYNTDLYYSDEVLMLIDFDHDEILNRAQENNWMSADDVGVTKKFMDDLQNVGFDQAITNYEERILNLNLTPSEFQKHNSFVNYIKIIDASNPELFPSELNVNNRSWWRCGLAIIAFTAATVGLTSCATIAACALAIALHYNASLTLVEQCGRDN